MNNLSAKQKFELVRTLKQQGKSRKQISEETGIPLNTIDNIATAIKKGFNSVSELYNYQARQKGHKNIVWSRMALHKLKRPIDLYNMYCKKRGYIGFTNYQAIRKVLKKDPDTPSSEITKSIDKLAYLESRSRISFPREYRYSFSQDDLDQIISNFGILTEREGDIINKRLEGKTLEEIRRDYGGMTRQGVERIEGIARRKIMRKLRILLPEEKIYAHPPTHTWDTNETQRRKAKNPERYTL